MNIILKLKRLLKKKKEKKLESKYVEGNPVTIIANITVSGLYLKDMNGKVKEIDLSNIVTDKMPKYLIDTGFHDFWLFEDEISMNEETGDDNDQ